MTEEEFYFKLRYALKITDYKKVAEHSNECIGKELSEVESRNEYKKGGINQFMCDSMNQKFESKDYDLEKLTIVKESFEDYHKYYTFYFNKDREDFFANFDECIKWFQKQNCKCGYCGINQKELLSIVCKRDRNLTLNRKSKRSKGTLEIEKKDSKESYTYDNCILACPLCNNAKSNLIDENDWRNIFAKPMREYYKKILGADLKYELPSIDA